MKRVINLLLIIIFVFSSNTAAFAQYARRDLPFNRPFDPNATIKFLNKMTQEGRKYENPFDRLPPILSKNYPQAVVAKTMRDYDRTVDDYTSNPAYKLTPKEMLAAMKYETDKMAGFLANNPRYKKELRKQRFIENGLACVNGAAMGALLVLCAPAAATYGGAGAGAWFGAASTEMLASYSAVSMSRTIFVVALLEMFTMLGQEIMDNLYDNLTQRLLKYRYLENQAMGRKVTANAAAGSILNENVITAMRKNAFCANPKNDKLNFAARWVDKDAQRETVIRLAGLRAINGYLQFSGDKTKYDMAMLDILSLFTDAPVKFDEKVFTKTVIADGEKKIIRHSDTVDVNPGRLLPRTKELRKALTTIQNM